MNAAIAIPARVAMDLDMQSLVYVSLGELILLLRGNKIDRLAAIRGDFATQVDECRQSIWEPSAFLLIGFCAPPPPRAKSRGSALP